ncbi:Gfo/Idh/MocA family protein [Leuconostoc gelidum]|uniref:Gfo/Idh/MocA family protein n=1 Tax=Leuconostoc gelidum TaxID=1244 RepID=UPI0002193CD0|nr:Gfo/Idh/MocA family oxidoreductase [Leuconostoc gelidum]AFS40416.1 NAD-dependent oxidoreductase [Leuconostoc gelidum JB7]MBZ5978361.1 Gfo/Idh/MocA family oxidoreductase [Leuconostoc gelidum subsp. gelidum]MBZ5992680.1 Gfo/Idh/MocA family oxidoreductase [Leuconostoc gelidum subsp. gelidum]USP16402.1 Gfo/Idh/MocA family oxidoreductase [Leuconostoc gelidum subsp. aenigmaticum]GMA68228.1 oxidoreductase [Leuconostoc gelidum subsp. gelidum]
MRLNWAIIGTGTIANEMATSFMKKDKNIYAVCGRNIDKMQHFADKYHIEKQCIKLEALLSDEHVDAVYIATPHNTHFEIAKQALLYDKHVLVEKAIVTNRDELDELNNIAYDRNLMIMEAITLLHMPLIKKVKSLVAAGALGDIKTINVTFGSHKPYDVKNRFFNPDLAGGALLDIGGYAFTAARYFMSEQPTNVSSFVNYFETGVDEQSATIISNSKNELATISLSMQAKQPKALTISGTKGYIRVLEFPRAQEATWYHTETKTCEVIISGNTDDALVYEVEDFEDAIENPNQIKVYNDMTADVFSIFQTIQTEWQSNN